MTFSLSEKYSPNIFIDKPISLDIFTIDLWDSIRNLPNMEKPRPL